MAKIKQPFRAETLDPCDLILAAFGPWHKEAGVEGDKPLWNPRVDTDRLRALWRDHEPAIRGAAAATGVEESWIEQRLWFVEQLR